jgi:hypothetical protein
MFLKSRYFYFRILKPPSFMRTVAIFIFDDVEVLDFTGPFEIFGVAGKQNAGNGKIYDCCSQ